MNIENTEINGFLIDQFNQYSLKPGSTQGTCPLCSHTRQPKNTKLQCASYDWERGLGTCHNCDTSFQLHTYQRKGNAKVVWTNGENGAPAPRDNQPKAEPAAVKPEDLPF